MKGKLYINYQNTCYNFAKAIAKKWFYKFNGPGNASFDLDDLTQSGLAALCDYARKKPFDTTMGVSFHTYAYKRVNGAVVDYILSMQHIRIPKSQRLKLYELKKAEALLQKEYPDEPINDEKLAFFLKTTVEDISDVRLLMPIYETFGEKQDHDEGTIDRDPLSDEERRLLADDVHECRQSIQKNKKHIRDILIMDAWSKGATLEQLAKTFDIAIETARRKKNVALAAMKNCLEKKEWTLSDVIALEQY